MAILDKTLAWAQRWSRMPTSAEMRRHMAVVAAEAKADHNRRGRAGRNVNDGEMTPLASPRKGRYKGATGPPRLPFGDRSGVIANFDVEVHQLPNGWELRQGYRDGARASAGGVFARLKRKLFVGGTRDVPFTQLAKWQEDGAGRNPRGRETLGISPTFRRRLGELNRDFLANFGRGS